MSVVGVEEVEGCRQRVGEGGGVVGVVGVGRHVAVVQPGVSLRVRLRLSLSLSLSISIPSSPETCKLRVSKLVGFLNF